MRKENHALGPIESILPVLKRGLLELYPTAWVAAASLLKGFGSPLYYSYQSRV
jgi:hypothetical protein